MTWELIKPFPPESIHWRIGNKSKDKKKATALAYINARDVMDRLDSVLGLSGWKDEYHAEAPRYIQKRDRNNNAWMEQVCGRVTCKLSLKIDGEWITKSDAAGETNVEGEKGGVSDAFKRAAVKFGIGRDLYRLDTNWYPIDEWGKFTQTPKLPSWYMNKLVSLPYDEELRLKGISEEIISLLIDGNINSAAKIWNGLSQDDVNKLWRPKTQGGHFDQNIKNTINSPEFREARNGSTS